MGERFALFYWAAGSHFGGWKDLKAVFDSAEDARTYLHGIDEPWDFAHCVNLQSEYIVWEESTGSEGL